MLNTLDDYISHSLPTEGDFSTHPDLVQKVDGTGCFLPFYGNTVVFLLEEQTQQQLEELRQTLYTAAGEILAEPLSANTFHMTLHDLANGRPNQPGLEKWMQQTKEKAQQILNGFTSFQPLEMKGTWLFNMVNTSIVLGLSPADVETSRQLTQMYAALEQVRPLGYALTPHITIAYFRPGRYPQAYVRRLNAALHPVEITIRLHGERLMLQSFQDMNHYSSCF